MGHIKFKLEDGSALSCDYLDNTNFVVFEHQLPESAPVQFRMHRIQLQALVKSLNVPLNMGAEFTKPVKKD